MIKLELTEKRNRSYTIKERQYRTRAVLKDGSFIELYEGSDWSKAYSYSEYPQLSEERKRKGFNFLQIEMLTRNRGWEVIRRFG